MKVAVIGQFRVPPENMAAIRPLMAKVIAASCKESGCIAYSYAEDVMEPGLIRVSELWESRKHLDAHLGAPHMTEWRAEREALGLTGRKLMAYAVSNEDEF